MCQTFGDSARVLYQCLGFGKTIASCYVVELLFCVLNSLYGVQGDVVCPLP